MVCQYLNSLIIRYILIYGLYFFPNSGIVSCFWTMEVLSQFFIQPNKHTFLMGFGGD
jgi:hypothetical protein